MKGLDLTRPGGLVAVVTSRFTLDAQADAARQEMAERADLLGAIRLPGRDLPGGAGTDVVTDIVVLSQAAPRCRACRRVVAVARARWPPSTARWPSTSTSPPTPR